LIINLRIFVEEGGELMAAKKKAKVGKPKGKKQPIVTGGKKGKKKK
jgi:hypothetical protein